MKAEKTVRRQTKRKTGRRNRERGKPSTFPSHLCAPEESDERTNVGLIAQQVSDGCVSRSRSISPVSETSKPLPPIRFPPDCLLPLVFSVTERGRVTTGAQTGTSTRFLRVTRSREGGGSCLGDRFAPLRGARYQGGETREQRGALQHGEGEGEEAEE